MNNFRIIKDQTLEYNGDQLYVMIIKINEKFYFQIDTKYKGICRRTMFNRKTAELAVESITKSLSVYKDISSATKILELALKLKSLREFLFVLKMNKQIEYEEIFIQKKHFGYYTHPIALEDSSLDCMEIHDEIAITFPNQNSPIGFYRPIFKDSNTYMFHLNEFYSFKD